MTWIRRILLGLCAVVALAAVALLVLDGTFLSRTYLEPWQPSYYKQFDDPRLQVAAHGLLAPNAHNMQSWKLVLSQENGELFALYTDPERLLPVSDPFARQVTMSQGTFLDNVAIAATKLGYRADIVLFPKGEYDHEATAESVDTHPVAFITLQPHQPQTSPLYDAISRATIKAPLEATPVPQSAIDQLLGAGNDHLLQVRIFTEQLEVDKIRGLTVEAMAIDLSQSVREEGGLFRFTEWDKNKYRDGLSFGAFGLPAVQQFFMQALGGVIPVSDEAKQQMGVEMFSQGASSTPAYLLIISKGNSRTAQVKSGTLYNRLERIATTLGITLQPAEQILQEYPKMERLYRQFHKDYASPGQTIQMLAGIGYASVSAPYSPRRDLMDIVSEGGQETSR